MGFSRILIFLPWYNLYAILFFTNPLKRLPNIKKLEKHYKQKLIM